MTEYEAYQEHIRYTHDTYCRIVIRHASFDAARMLAARWKREISLEYLTEEKFVPLSTTDEYFQVPDYGETYPFSVRGQTILLDSCSLAAALARLPEQTQEEIFLYYFQHLTQKEIGEQSGWTRSTIGRHIRAILPLTSKCCGRPPAATSRKISCCCGCPGPLEHSASGNGMCCSKIPKPTTHGNFAVNRPMTGFLPMQWS